jgi:hypothetical protein
VLCDPTASLHPDLAVPGSTSRAATNRLAVAVGCFANWARNRTIHWVIIGLHFLIGGAVFLLSEAGIFAFDPRFIWPALAILNGVAFLLEK